MRAARLVGPRKWELVEADKPAASKGRMLVHMERVAICGTDRPGYEGMVPSYPLPLGATGHEGMGVVVDCPSGEYETGERVLLWGADRPLYQEYVVAGEEGCVRLPKDLEPEVVLMSQPLGTVIHCFYKLGNFINQNVVVLGQGPMGQLFNACLRNFGARKIIAIDVLAHRLEVGMKMGAMHTIDSSKTDPKEAVLELTDGNLADTVVEVVGRTPTFNLASSLVRHGGDFIYFGVPNKDDLEDVMALEFRRAFSNETRIITSVGPNPQRDYTVALDWIVQGRVDVRPILTHVLPFEQIQEGFEMFFDRPAESGSVKVVLKF